MKLLLSCKVMLPTMLLISDLSNATDFEKYIKAHFIHKRTSKYVDCPECGSKLNLSYIRGEKCPLCGTDLKPESTIEKINWYDRKADECAKKYRQEFWLAKIEYHC